MPMQRAQGVLLFLVRFNNSARFEIHGVTCSSSSRPFLCALGYAKDTCFDYWYTSKNVDYATVGNNIHEHMTCTCLYEHKSLQFCRIFCSSMIYQSLMALINNSVLCSMNPRPLLGTVSLPEPMGIHASLNATYRLHYVSINPLMLDKCTHHQAKVQFDVTMHKALGRQVLCQQNRWDGRAVVAACSKPLVGTR